MEHIKPLAFLFLQQLKIALCRWQEEYEYDIISSKKHFITSVEGQAFNLPGHKYTEEFSLTYYMVRDSKVRRYLIENELIKSGYQVKVEGLLDASDEKEVRQVLQKIIRSRTFYDIRARAEDAPSKFKLKPKYQYSLSAYVEGWQSKLITYNCYYYSNNPENEIKCFKLHLNLYNKEAKLRGFPKESEEWNYIGKWTQQGTLWHLTLYKNGQKEGKQLALTLLVGLRDILDLEALKGNFMGMNLENYLVSSEVFLQRINTKIKDGKEKTIEVAQQIRLNRKSISIYPRNRQGITLLNPSTLTVSILERYVGVYLVHQVNDVYLDTFVFRLYKDFRATFQHPDFFEGAIMNCTIDILNRGTTLQVSVLHRITAQVIILIIAKISDVKNLLVSQKQIIIDLTSNSYLPQSILFNQVNKVAALEASYLHPRRVKIAEVTDFNDLKEIDKLRESKA